MTIKRIRENPRGDHIKTFKKQGYVIHQVANNNFCLCKILKEYNSLEEAKNDLIKLLSNQITEKELLKQK